MPEVMAPVPGVVAVDDTQFATFMTDEHSGPALVAFGASWCRPCKDLRPNLESLAKKYAGRVTVLYYDVDKSHVYADQYSVRGIPTMILFIHGHTAGTLTGYQTLTRIEQFIESRLPISA